MRDRRQNAVDQRRRPGREKRKSLPMPGATRSIAMMDVLMLALTFGWFALAIGYAYACEQL
jgi:hypothetical protein